MHPSRAFLQIDDYALGFLTHDDIPQCFSMLLAKDNSIAIARLSLNEEALRSFIDETKLDIWSTSMMCFYKGQPVGFIVNAQSDMQSLNTRLFGIFTNVQESKVHILLFIRQLFWNFPVHRVYIQFPSVLTEYTSLYTSVGFEQEGIYRQHQIVAGQTYDVAILGLLRQDFEAWCNKYEPRFALK